MSTWAIYETGSGRISYVTDGPQAKLPEGLAAISVPQHFNPDDFIVSNGEIVKAPPKGSPPLSILRREAKLRVDQMAESMRNIWSTPGIGQQAVYAAKLAEANRYVQSPTSGDFPFLNAEVGITASTLAGVAVAVRAQNASWVSAAAQIEALRLSAKKAIDIATSVVGISEAAKVNWPMPEGV